MKAISIDTTSPEVTTLRSGPRTSSTYRHIRTSDLVSALETRGWVYDGGTARQTRRPEMQEFAHHVLRFSHMDLPRLEGSVPQVVIVNNHLGTGALRVMLGAFRIACANGLILASKGLGEVRTPHRGDLSDLVPTVESFFDSAGPILNSIGAWTKQLLTPSLAEDFARKAAKLRWDDDHDLVRDPSPLLVPMREADAAGTLWTTYNVLQENLTRGCFCPMRTPEGKIGLRKIRGLNSPTRQVDLNQQLFSLAQAFAA